MTAGQDGKFSYVTEWDIRSHDTTSATDALQLVKRVFLIQCKRHLRWNDQNWSETPEVVPQ